MGSKYVDKNVSKGKKRVDREEETKYKFDPLRLEIKYPGTAILLLQCEEKAILLAAAAALAKFGRKAQANLEVLFDLKIVNSVIPLIEHEDLFTRRFAAMLLAEMTAIPNVRNYLLESNYYIPHFTKILINDKDIFIQEFFSLILAEMSKDIFGAAQLLKQCSNMDYLFEKLESPDPDVKKNNIEIIYNLLQDPIGAEAIIKAKSFDLNLVYNLFNSPYREIQSLALNVVADLVSRNRDDHLQQIFRESSGLQALLKFLDNDEWKDLHTETLRILRLASDNSTTVELLNDIGGITQILKYVNDTQNSKLFMDALDVAVCLSNTPRGREALYTYGIIDHLLYTLKNSVQPNIHEIVCHGIGMMTLNNKPAKELTESNCVEDILEVFKNENLKLTSREAALFALNQLLKCDIKNCHQFLNIQGHNYLVRLMKQTEKTVYVEILVGVVECLTVIARNQTLRTILLHADVIDAICASFELVCPSMNDYKIACCNALSMLCVDKAGRASFLKAQGPNKLYNLLCDVKTIPVRNAATQLIQLLCADSVLSDAFVTAKYLNYMLNNRSTARVVPSWDTCIAALFDSHLPIKFAFTGRLSMHDVTQDGFYVLRRNVCPFPILDDIFKFKFCPKEPVYVVNCIRSHSSSFEEGVLRQSVVEKSDQISTEDITRKGVFLSSEILNMTMDSKFGRLQCDPCLYDYIELFKCKLVAAESKKVASETKAGLVNISYIASRAKILAKFVAQQMSGPDPLIRCVDHQLEIHLKEIKDSIETSVIPLGMLRVGSYFERALLFKVIADRIHLPAALVRGEYGKAWIEIAIPQVKDPSDEASFQIYFEKDTSCPEFIEIRESVFSHPYKEDIIPDHVPIDQHQFIFPTKLMRPNFIVDLMNSPGDLIPIGSRRAEIYCEKQLVCERICLN